MTTHSAKTVNIFNAPDSSDAIQFSDGSVLYVYATMSGWTLTTEQGNYRAEVVEFGRYLGMVEFIRAIVARDAASL